jgi:hypothetical protein
MNNCMMKLVLFCLVLSFFHNTNSAQDIVLDKNVDKQYTEEKGPNMPRYRHIYLGLAMVVPYNNLPGSGIDLGRSAEILIGYRYKVKLSSFYAIGFDISNRFVRFGIKSEEDLPVDINSNPLSQASLVDKLGLSLTSMGLEAYNRFNFGKRGNTLGNYLDIGIKEEWNYGRKMIIKDDAPDGSYFEKSRKVEKKLLFIEKFSTILTARIGINKVSIYGNYRISDLITSGYLTPELPPLTTGIQVAF